LRWRLEGPLALTILTLSQTLTGQSSNLRRAIWPIMQIISSSLTKCIAPLGSFRYCGVSSTATDGPGVTPDNICCWVQHHWTCCIRPGKHWRDELPISNWRRCRSLKPRPSPRMYSGCVADCRRAFLRRAMSVAFAGARTSFAAIWNTIFPSLGGASRRKLCAASGPCWRTIRGPAQRGAIRPQSWGRRQDRCGLP